MDQEDDPLWAAEGAEVEGGLAARNDAIAINRTLPVPPASGVAEVAPGYQPAPVRERRRLRRVSEEEVSSVVQALQQYAARGGEIRTDLGDLVAKSTTAEHLAERIEAARATHTALVALLGYTKELLTIAKSDGLVLLAEAHDEIMHRARRQPQLLRTYDYTVRLIAARGEVISEGLARRRKSEQSEPRPAARKRAAKAPAAEESPSDDTPA
ncbi:MAG TPA: hypothetical protein VH877_10305 [Polyangia bacterium]|nr:hypothetical protein [Polyangia bacterium]